MDGGSFVEDGELCVLFLIPLDRVLPLSEAASSTTGSV